MEFQPSHEYIQECLKAAPVVRLINRKKRVFFVVTGIKAVTGAVAHSSAQTGHKTALGVEVDASVLGGVPISLGPKIDWEGKITQETSWKGSSDFVFAYRVQKLTVSRSGGVAQQDVTKGTMLGDDRRRTAESFVFDVSELNHDEVVDSGFKFEDASEGGLCAILLE